MKSATTIPLAVQQDFPILSRPLVDSRGRERKLIYLDNGATTQKPHSVIQAITHYYSHSNSNVHRAIHTLGEEATRLYEEARVKVMGFIGASSYKEVIFTRGTTESLNLLAKSLQHELMEGDIILLTEMEHHSNLVPWQMVAQEKKIELRFIPVTPKGELDLNFLETLPLDRVKILSMTHMSNVLGTINPAKELCAWAKENNIISILDGAQSVPHIPINVQDLDVDFLAFSGHKMVGPTGIGVLYGKEERLKNLPPFLGGGEMIGSVTYQSFTTNDLPYKFEAGTPNMAGAIGLGAAVDYLQSIGMKEIQSWEEELILYATQAFSTLPQGKIYGQSSHKGGILSFSLGNIHSHDLAAFLDQKGIAVRAGHHCAHPLVRKFNVNSTTRASFYFYNTKEDIDFFIQSLKEAQEFFS